MSRYNHCSLNNRIDSIHDTMFDSHGYFYIKDLKGRYLYLNKNALEAIGSSNISELLGKNDFSSLFPWKKEHAELYKKNDRLALPNQSALAVVEITTTHKQKDFIALSNKKPFYHNGEKTGVSGLTLRMPNVQTATINSPISQDSIFFDMKKCEALKLTNKQKMVTYHLLQGLPAKEIASRLFLSKRTVEHHINSIKDINEYASTKELLLYVRMI